MASEFIFGYKVRSRTRGKNYSRLSLVPHLTSRLYPFTSSGTSSGSYDVSGL